MIMREILLCLLLGLFFTACFGSACVPAQCLKCNYTVETVADSCSICSARCINMSVVPSDCKTDFQVSINSTVPEPDEGDDITLTCVHNLPNVNLTFEWEKEGEGFLEGQNKSQLVLESVLSDKNGRYYCFVNSTCGHFQSSPLDVTVKNNSVVILIICGVSALALVLILGIAMKYKLKRDNAQHKQRRMQREQNEQRAIPAPFIP
ncbi:uncharacterized protein LOC132981820 [Labrus mixtus]|uniref:uncharacterized protein LOC132981820 n=1 Tax=Labrus mixtus TaxID=508554 RepID=UPI0029C0853C|nr:uncharacterized protein LOC132981820 [Labrus mixtus]